jgi:beta-phosphoglucomutase
MIKKRLNHDYNISANEIVSAKDVEKGKPHPEPYLTALRKAGCKADEAIVIENAPLGVESANNANIYTIVINTGPLDPQTLLDAGGAIVVEESKEIKDFLKNQYPGGCV